MVVEPHTSREFLWSDSSIHINGAFTPHPVLNPRSIEQ